jgi:TonB family protein
MLSSFLDWFEEHKAGVIGTLAVHTAALFICTLLYLRSTPREDEVSDMRIEVVSEPEAEEMVQRILNEEGIAEKVTNLSSNITAQVRPHFSATKLAERVEGELRDLEQAEFDRLAEERRARGETEPEVPALDPSKWSKERYMDKAVEPVKVEGATTVWHDLKDRVRVEGIPAYLCKEQGRVAIRVTVERSGRVRKAELDRSQSYNWDDCMLEQAMQSAQRTPFLPNAGAADPQVGTVYFRFMPQ